MDKEIHVVCLPKKVKREEVEKALNDARIQYLYVIEEEMDENYNNYKIYFENKVNQNFLVQKIKNLKLINHPNDKMDIFYYNYEEQCLEIPKPFAFSEIRYKRKYDYLVNQDYVLSPNSNFLLYTNKQFLEKQRNMFSFFIKQIGTNLMTGKSIMSVSLPIFIFDTRSLLEMFVCQNAYCVRLLERGGMMHNPVERLKYSTAYAISKLHLCVTQEKPFNPILGETFQCKIENSFFYVEQTSHHPPRSNFYVVGKNYKLYGYNEPEASLNINSCDISAKGRTIIEYPDGTRHFFGNSKILLGGTVMGDRTLDFTGSFQVVDQKNKLIAHVDINPDERGFIGNFVSNKNTFPDYCKGIITEMSNATYDKEKGLYIIKDKNKKLSSFEGEFSGSIEFDGKVLWELKDNNFPKMFRQKIILPSDSCFREDLYFLIQGKEDQAGIYKNIMEEKQRKDRKLREDFVKNGGKVKKITLKRVGK